MTEDALETGIVRIKGKNAVYMDPVRVLSAAYASHVVKSDAYYSRAFFTSASVLTPTPAPTAKEEECGASNKRKRKRRVYNLNEKEALAESRHQVSVFILYQHSIYCVNYCSCFFLKFCGLNSAIVILCIKRTSTFNNHL